MGTLWSKTLAKGVLCAHFLDRVAGAALWLESFPLALGALGSPEQKALGVFAASLFARKGRAVSRGTDERLAGTEAQRYIRATTLLRLTRLPRFTLRLTWTCGVYFMGGPSLPVDAKERRHRVCNGCDNEGSSGNQQKGSNLSDSKHNVCDDGQLDHRHEEILLPSV